MAARVLGPRARAAAVSFTAAESLIVPRPLDFDRLNMKNRYVSWSGPTACVECRTFPHRHARCLQDGCKCPCAVHSH